MEGQDQFYWRAGWVKTLILQSKNGYAWYVDITIIFKLKNCKLKQQENGFTNNGLDVPTPNYGLFQ